jgi:hypothetical protein
MTRGRQQAELARRQAAELAALEGAHLEQREVLQREQQADLLEIRQRHVIEQVALWRQQGRKLGAWARSVLAAGRRR